MTYPGGKAGSGTYQTIINQIPPHDTYIEAFLGGGAILERKRPAQLNIGLDLSDAVITRARNFWRSRNNAQHSFEFSQTDAITWLGRHVFQGETFIYCDPPYMRSTRTREFYQHEMTDAQHGELLKAIKALPCMVMISGYTHELYEHELADWRLITFTSMTRGGPATEYLWMNYPEPTELHDYRFLGSNYRERERIQKRNRRWTKRLMKLPPLERAALKQLLIEGESLTPKTDDAAATPLLALSAARQSQGV